MVYEHETPSEVWEVTHNFNTSILCVECWVEIDGTHTKILPLSIENKTPNLIIITFTRPYTGKATISPVKHWRDER